MTEACTRALARGVAALVIACLAFIARPASADGFEVESAMLRLDNDIYLLDAEFDLRLSDEVIEALRNGVAITVVFETDVVHVRQWRWNETLADIEARYSLEYYALSGQYVLRNLELGISSSYRSLAPLLRDLGQLRDFPLIARSRLTVGETHRVRVRARLDIESLPAPLRPLAYLSSLWRLSSDWYEVPLQP